MGEERNNAGIIFKVIIALFVASLSIVTINKGFFMDEAGLLATYKGIYQGNRMFIDSWGPLQMGGLITYPLFALYYECIGGFLEAYGIGFVLSMRGCYLLIRFLVALYLYLTIRKTKYKDGAFVAALVYYCFFTSFKNLSYKSICDLAIMLFICWGILFFYKNNPWYFILMGVATCVAIIAYPVMIIFPFFILVYFILMGIKGYDTLAPMIIYIVTCIIIGIAVLLYLQLTAGIMNILPQLQYIEDSAYKNPMYIRVGKIIVSYLAFGVVAYIPVVIIELIKKIRHVDEKTTFVVLSLYWILFMAGLIAVRPLSTSMSRFLYGCIVLFWWCPYIFRDKESSEYTRIGHYKLPDFDEGFIVQFIFVVAAVSQLVWAIATNQGVAIPANMAIYVVVAIMMKCGDEGEGLALLKIAVTAAAVFFMGIWVAEGDGGYSDIFEARTMVTEGAFAGIELDETDYSNNRDCYELLNRHVTSSDRLYVVYGFAYSAYLDTDALQGAGQPYSRAGKGQTRVLDYWRVNPENQADYILVDTANKYYDEYHGGETDLYVQENYESVDEQESFILYKRKSY